MAFASSVTSCPAIVETGCRPRKSEGDHETQESEYRSFDRTGSLGFRVAFPLATTETAAGLEKKQHSDEKTGGKVRRVLGKDEVSLVHLDRLSC